MHVRSACQGDMRHIAAIHAACFARQHRSSEWIACQFAAYPLKRIFVATLGGEGEIVGYLILAEKSGFRQDVVIELEQIAVAPEQQGRGVAAELICNSLSAVEQALIDRGATMRSVLVTTRSDNAAQKLYRKVLGAEIVARIPSLFDAADEVVMLSNLLPGAEARHKKRN